MKNRYSPIPSFLYIKFDPDLKLDNLAFSRVFNSNKGSLELVKEDNISLILITHDLAVVSDMADEIAIMQNGIIVEIDKTQNLFRNMKHPYTRSLFAASGHSVDLPSAKRSTDLLLTIQNVTCRYRLARTKIFSKSDYFTAVSNVSFDIKNGERVGLVGESGSGKSTVAKLVTRLIRPSGGSIYLDGENKRVTESRNVPLQYRKDVQMVFQDPFGSLNSIHTVYHHLSRPLYRHRLKDKITMLPYIIDLLEKVGLSPGEKFAEKFPHEMSGGERQRVAIARALSLEPKIVVADEPTSMLDVSIRMEILEIFAKMRIENNLTVLFITHDLASARYLADRIIVLKNGKIIEENNSEKLIQNPREDYTKQLVNAASPGWLNQITK